MGYVTLQVEMAVSFSIILQNSALQTKHENFSSKVFMVKPLQRVFATSCNFAVVNIRPTILDKRSNTTLLAQHEILKRRKHTMLH